MPGKATGKKVQWGILGAASIAVRKVIPGMQKGEWSDIVAIASRDKKKAEDAARALGIPKAYGSYEELLCNNDVEAIYNPLPNHLHVPWSVKAAEAGKHVLCEKPLSLTVAEARSLLRSDIVAIASRDKKKAEDAARALGIPKAYGSYEELLCDNDVEAIYNPLPNHLHVPWSVKAAEAGKHVLCEKPLSLTVAEARSLL